MGSTGKEVGKRHPTLNENVVVRAGAKILGNISIGRNTRIGAGSVVVKNVEDECTVVGIPGRVIHQWGARIDPLEHSALPDAEARVIMNLMERIDELESQVREFEKYTGKQEVNDARFERDQRVGKAQSLQDKEIIEYLGEE